jgi:hypothetical protein
MASKKSKSIVAEVTTEDEKELTKTEQLFIDTFGAQEQAHESNYVTIGKLKELLQRAGGELNESSEEESGDEPTV